MIPLRRAVFSNAGTVAAAAVSAVAVSYATKTLLDRRSSQPAPRHPSARLQPNRLPTQNIGREDHVAAKGSQGSDIAEPPPRAPLSARRRRAHLSARIQAQWRAERVAQGLPAHPPWHQDVFLLVLAGILASVAVTAIGIGIQWLVGQVVGLYVGIAFVVILGASGLVLRGIGELKTSRRLKAGGYFLGAMA